MCDLICMLTCVSGGQPYMSVHIKTQYTQHDFKTITNAKNYMYWLPAATVHEISFGSYNYWSDSYWVSDINMGNINVW